MKFILLALLLSSSAFAYEKVKINGQLYVAQGFDDNDLVQIVVVGTLPDTCYRNPTFEIEHNNNKYAIRLLAHYVPLREGCRDVSVTYTEIINFGMMNAGKYELSLVNKRMTHNKKLEVKASINHFMDDFLYGNVSGIIENESNRQVELVGVNPDNCMVFTKMTSEVQESMIILRPQFKEMGHCENKPTSFRIKYTVPYLPNKSQGLLLHVRLMNGRSYNYLYQNHL